MPVPRLGRMSMLSRSLVPLVLVALVAGCGGPSATPPAGTDGPPPDATEQPEPPGGDAIDHPTGPTDVILRYEEGGGFMMPSFLVTIAPIFTLYGDGTIVFRDPRDEVAPDGPVMRQNPFRTAVMSEAQVQELLAFALGEGGLGVARPTYENPMIADAGTAVFTVRAGGLDKTVSVYALGLDGEGVPDLPARAAFQRLAERLMNIDNDGAFFTDVYVPEAYRGILIDEGGFADGAPMPWPFADLTEDDFTVDPTNQNLQFPSRVMTPDEAAELGIENFEGGLSGISIRSPDGSTTYSFALRPLLPDEEE